ncbi:MAG: hypothetical protein ISS70_07575 [Phycisphaerae bacterium]|nr:hypothetical protein [Phycisphaerae bacterium]
MAISIKVNDRCLVRHQDCKRIFGGSRTCFVACPNSDEIALELDIIRQKLREANIEPYIAVDQRDFQKDIFCEKICTKVIESLFCIVILNDVTDSSDNTRKPNANVYYEYGLMTAFRKRIIPVQLERHSLAFNIQSLDTLKYTHKNFSTQIEEAIRMTLLDIEADQSEKDDGTTEDNVEWTLDLMGLVRAEERFRFRHERVLMSKSLGFQPYIKPQTGNLFYVGIFNPIESEQDVLLRTKMLTLRIKNYCQQIQNDLSDMQQTGSVRPRTYVDERIAESEKLLTDLSEVNILVIKKNLVSPSKFTKAYAKAVKDMDFKLTLEVLDDKKIKKLLGV